MKQIHIITPFENMVKAVIGESILGRAEINEFVKYHIHDLFQYADPPHFKIDDYPFGGGCGMIMKPEPLFRAYQAVIDQCENKCGPKVIFPSPDGELLTHKKALELSKCEHLIIINGHYKGVDQRVRDHLVTEEISIGDYVLTGGELPALIILDAMIRLIPGVISNYESAETDSFATELLDSPHYTRPENYDGISVPEILLSGHHKKIADWRLKKREKKTCEKRPDLWKKYLTSREIGGDNG